MNRINRSFERRKRHFRQKYFMSVRPAIQRVKDIFHRFPIVGCEIGTFRGIHAEQMLKALPHMKKLYLVDPYERYDNYTDFDKIGGIEPTFFTTAQSEARNRLKKYEDRIEWVQAPFDSSLINDSLNFVYIDGNHACDAVTHDIIHATKLVYYGVIGGHDYYPLNHHMNDKFGVGKAVREYYGNNFNWKFNDWWTHVYN